MTICPTCGYQFDDRTEETLSQNPMDPDRTKQTNFSKCPKCTRVLDNSHLETTLAAQSDQPRMIHRFRLEELLGSGGFGEVWKAIDTRLERPVALKLSNSRLGVRYTLMYEATTVADFHHPNIVSVFDVGEWEGRVFIASELIEGLTLKDILSAGKIERQRGLNFLLTIAGALHYAHERGVVHRDVKPANILVDRSGNPFVADFGIAKRASSQDSSTDEGRVIGTARYMSPEQAAGKASETNRRADIYALGVILFEMLTGELPFRGNARAIQHQKTLVDAPSPRTLDASIPKDLETICLKCLERDPNKRFDTAQELIDELKRFEAGEPIHSRPISHVERLYRWCRRRPTIAGLLLGLFISLTTGLLGVTYFWQRASAHADTAFRSLYRSRMNLVALRMREGDVLGVREILSEVDSHPQLSHLKGFEWHYFRDNAEQINVIGSMPDAISSLVATQHGEYCAAIGKGDDVRIWNTQTKELIRTLDCSTSESHSIDFSPANSRLAAGCKDGKVRIFEPLQHSNVIQEVLHGRAVEQVRFSPNGDYLASVGNKGAVRLWKSNSYEKIAEVPIGKDLEFGDLTFSADSQFLVIATKDGTIRVWRIATVVDSFKNNSVPQPEHNYSTNSKLQSIALSDDQQSLAFGEYSGQLNVLEIPTGNKTSSTTGVWGPVTTLEFLSGSKTLVFNALDGKTHFFDVATNKLTRSVTTHTLHSGTLYKTFDGRKLLIGGGDGIIEEFDIQINSLPTVLWHDSPVRSLAYFADGNRLLACYDDGLVRIWETLNGEFKNLSEGYLSRFLAMKPDRKIFVTASDKSNVKVWNADSLASEHDINPGIGIVSVLKFSSSGKFLAVAGNKGIACVYADGDWQNPVVAIAANKQPINAIEFAPNENLIVIAYEDRSIRAFGLPQGTEVTKWDLATEPTQLAFLDSGKTLVACDHMGTLTFFDTATSKFTSSKAHVGRVNAIVSLSKEKSFVTGGRDRELRIWDTRSRELIAPLVGHERQIFTVCASPDEKTIASGGLAGDIRLWRGVGF